MFNGMHGGWGMHWGWWLLLIFLVVLVAWAVSRGLGSGRRTQLHEETPLERLQRRYAEGDISTEEYEERKAHLEGRNP